jgi:hypothetical protein
MPPPEFGVPPSGGALAADFSEIDAKRGNNRGSRRLTPMVADFSETDAKGEMIEPAAAKNPDKIHNKLICIYL